MIWSMLLPLQGGNKKQFIHTPRALPWADGSLALRAASYRITAHLGSGLNPEVPPTKRR